MPYLMIHSASLSQPHRRTVSLTSVLELILQNESTFCATINTQLYYVLPYQYNLRKKITAPSQMDRWIICLLYTEYKQADKGLGYVQIFTIILLPPSIPQTPKNKQKEKMQLLLLNESNVCARTELVDDGRNHRKECHNREQ